MCLSIGKLPDDQYTQSRYFSDMPKSSVMNFQTLTFFLCPADLRSFERSTNNHHTLHVLPAWCWPHSCLLKAFRSRNPILLLHISLWTSCIIQKHIRVLSPYLCVCNGVFSNWIKNFRLICCSMFIVCSLVLIAEQPVKEEE